MNDRVSNKLGTQIRCKSLSLQLVYCYDPRGDLSHEAVFLVKLCLLTKQLQEKLNHGVLVRLPSGAPAFS